MGSGCYGEKCDDSYHGRRYVEGIFFFFRINETSRPSYFEVKTALNYTRLSASLRTSGGLNRYRWGTSYATLSHFTEKRDVFSSDSSARNCSRQELQWDRRNRILLMIRFFLNGRTKLPVYFFFSSFHVLHYTRCMWQRDITPLVAPNVNPFATYVRTYYNVLLQVSITCIRISNIIM